jgi:hypothetical protein
MSEIILKGHKVSKGKGTGEALVSFLDEKGQPGIVERAFVLPPWSRIGSVTPAERQAIIQGSVLFGHYEKLVDRESAYEMLKARAEKAAAESQAQAQAEAQARQGPYGYPPPGQGRSPYPQEPRRPAGRSRDTLIEAMAKSAARSVGSSLGRQILRGVLGSILGGSRR